MKENQNNYSGETRDYSVSDLNGKSGELTKPFDAVEEKEPISKEVPVETAEDSKKGRNKKRQE